MTNNLAQLSAAGVAVWLDDISRERLNSGGLEKLRTDDNVVGVTSNPTIFASAIAGSDLYADQIHDLAIRKVTVDEAVRMITTFDVRWGCHVMRPAYDASNGTDGRVSIEVDPRLADQTDATIAEAKQLWWLVDRPNLFIKIPATQAGLPAITEVLATGISVNVTLIFSLDRYVAVLDAWLTGLEKAQQHGYDLSSIESVASFFVSRVDTEIDKRLDKIGTPEALALKGKAAVANARLAYAAYQEVTGGARWAALEAAGARPQRPLWASTGTKNPDYPDTLYVDQLVAPGTVNTMPEKTLRATADHAVITGDTITPHLEEAADTMAALQAVGVDYNDVVEFLERDGVAKFEASWTELLDGVQQKLEAARG
ncbi:transaldolase [Allocatelliglobosispora scoriae]|uniref:Transaldolase n=1 Tax=Allocatelliglobosispora scoriae TaxID=643052 RepID=A0A841BQZ8_9ACTN|nr:transaldolase [Allocatelliglobosispora scoriae]MBB5869240.1 transaldolase [Allocatelliglobosispora scoriae]